jgi:hypothetical protein
MISANLNRMNFIFRTDLQTLEEFVFGVKRWKARWELYPTDQINPINLCDNTISTASSCKVS